MKRKTSLFILAFSIAFFAYPVFAAKTCYKNTECEAYEECIKSSVIPSDPGTCTIKAAAMYTCKCSYGGPVIDGKRFVKYENISSESECKTKCLGVNSAIYYGIYDPVRDTEASIKSMRTYNCICSDASLSGQCIYAIDNSKVFNLSSDNDCKTKCISVGTRWYSFNTDNALCNTKPLSIATPNPADTNTANPQIIDNEGLDFPNPLQFITVEGFLAWVLTAVQRIIVVLALVFIVIGALLMLTSAGNTEMVERGKKAITMAMVGFAIGIAAPAFLREIASILGWIPAEDIDTSQIDQALTLSQIAMNVLNFLLGISGVLALIMLVIGGIMYLTSAGDEERIASGKKIFTYSVIGVVVIFSAMVLVRQIAKLITGV